MRRLAVIICSLLITLAAHAQDASVLLPYVTAGKEVAWSPLSLGSKLACWFDASDGATLLDAGGAPADAAEAVQTWQDKSGNGRHATAPAEAQRPTRQVGVQNGLGVLRTDGDDQMLMNTARGVFRNKPVGHLFVVLYDSNQAGGNTVHYAVSWGSNTVLSRFGVTGRSYTTPYLSNVFGVMTKRLNTDDTKIALLSANGGHNLVHGFADWENGFIRGSMNGGEYVSEALESSGNCDDTDSSNATLFRGSGVIGKMPADSEIAEIIVVNAAMRTDEIQATERYLKDKWGTP